MRKGSFEFRGASANTSTREVSYSPVAVPDMRTGKVKEVRA
jgi:hypothetical protein